jgi:hypothetical protein
LWKRRGINHFLRFSFVSSGEKKGAQITVGGLTIDSGNSEFRTLPVIGASHYYAPHYYLPPFSRRRSPTPSRDQTPDTVFHIAGLVQFGPRDINSWKNQRCRVTLRWSCNLDRATLKLSSVSVVRLSPLSIFETCKIWSFDLPPPGFEPSSLPQPLGIPIQDPSNLGGSPRPSHWRIEQIACCFLCPKTLRVFSHKKIV